jgi:hypothetical protein
MKAGAHRHRRAGVLACALIPSVTCAATPVVHPASDRSQPHFVAGSDHGPRQVSWNDVAGTWVGHFVCADGITDLKLTIEPYFTDTFKEKPDPYREPDPIFVNARFDTFPMPENPAVSAASYRLTGSFLDRRGSLKPSEGAQPPPGSRLVGLSGEISGDGTTFSGTIDGEGCRSFTLRKGAHE